VRNKAENSFVTTIRTEGYTVKG